MRNILLILIVLNAIHPMWSQGQQGVLYTFDDCSGIDSAQFSPPATIDGSPDCVCGVMGNSLLLDGNNDRVLIPDTVRGLFEDDFTVSFYINLDNTSGVVDLFSYRTTCDKDSSFAITYTPITNTIRAEFAQDFNNIFELDGNLDQSKCWHQIHVTKFNLQYSLFINGRFITATEADRIIRFGRNAKIAIANSQCLAFTQERLSGNIDELEILNFALSPQQIQNEFLFPDQIITPDATIFAGEQIMIETGVSCASNISWTPTDDLDNPSIPNPTVTGSMTTDFVAIFSNEFCTSRDTIRVNVVDPSLLDCNDLLLPNAFTPNNDGLNDFYGISNSFLIDDLISFEIFNRSGSIIFKSTNVGDQWDGRFNGEMTNPGMYVYSVRYMCDGQEFSIVNNFSVLR